MATLNDKVILGLHLGAGASDGYLLEAANVLYTTSTSNATDLQTFLESLESNNFSSYVTSGSYDSSDKVINLFSQDGTICSTIDATEFVKDGMLSSAEITTTSMSVGTYLVDGYRLATFDGGAYTLTENSYNNAKVGSKLYTCSSSGAVLCTTAGFAYDGDIGIANATTGYWNNSSGTLTSYPVVDAVWCEGCFTSQEAMESENESSGLSGTYIYTQGTAYIAVYYHGSMTSTSEAGSGVYYYSIGDDFGGLYYSGTGRQWTLVTTDTIVRSSSAFQYLYVYHSGEINWYNSSATFDFASCVGIYTSSSDFENVLDTEGVYLHLTWNTDAGKDVTTIDLSELIDTDTTNSSISLSGTTITITDSANSTVSTTLVDDTTIKINDNVLTVPLLQSTTWTSTSGVEYNIPTSLSASDIQVSFDTLSFSSSSTTGDSDMLQISANIGGPTLNEQLQSICNFISTLMQATNAAISAINSTIESLTAEDITMPAYSNDFVSWSEDTVYNVITRLYDNWMHFFLGGKWTFNENYNTMHYEVDMSEITNQLFKSAVFTDGCNYLANINIKDAFDYYIDWEAI